MICAGKSDFTVGVACIRYLSEGSMQDYKGLIFSMITFRLDLQIHKLSCPPTNWHLQRQRRKAKLQSGAVRLGVQVSSRGGLYTHFNLAAEPKATKGLGLEVRARSLVTYRDTLLHYLF